MLAGDADRDRVAEVLKDAFAEGRLTQDEYEQRIGCLYRARTYRELDLLVSDVPRPGPPGPPGPLAPLPPGPPRTNQYAVASLVCGVAGTFLGLPAVPAVVLGHLSRRQIRRTGEQGDGLAVAGMVLGYLVSAVMLACLVLFVVALAALAHDTG